MQRMDETTEQQEEGRGRKTMSMNLHTDKIDLWQTPTWVTKVCLYTETAEGKRVQDKWHATRFRYAEWVRSSLTGVWDDDAAYEHQKALVKDHLDALYALGEIEFWEM
jgi:hypothetical protein